MNAFSIKKSIAFCYGHRLLRYQGKCRFLHGHNATVEIELTSNALDQRGMVADFSEIKDRVKAWIDENLDHKMLLHCEDPLVPILQEQGEPFLSMEANPTAENIAKLLFQKVAELGFPVQAVTLWETPSSHATYRK